MMEVLKKSLYWFLGIVFTIISFILIEGSLIVTSRTLGVTKATLLRVAFTIPLSWLVIYLSTKSSAGKRFQGWLAKRKEALSLRAQKIVKGTEFIAILNTAIFLGPIIASILMIMIGIEARKVYIYCIFCAIICAWSWCSFYAGLFWGFDKVCMLR